MTAWDIRVLLRALSATLLGLVVVWLVTAASDEGLTAGARAGRTLPLAPLCSAVGAALALGTARVRQEVRAFEALGRSPAQTSGPAALGAALPSLVVALAIMALPAIDVAGFYPRAIRGEVFEHTEAGFVSPTLGVRIDPSGETQTLDLPPRTPDDELPRGARIAAGAATGLAGLALALITARATIRRSLLGAQARRRMRAIAVGEGIGCIFATLVAFQAAAARLAPPAAAIVPPALLLAVALVRLFWGGARFAEKTTRGPDAAA